ncbi:MAG TPA: hypothetical protein VG964_02755 [Candidatus Saccharimonadales bacterium]|nr:hypothetical protein [Candidatus Saccharimonadales bacterium]
MSGLQIATDIIAIVFMSVVLLLIAALVVMVFVIRAKIINIEKKIEHKVDEATDLAERGGEILAAVGKTVAKRTVRKVKKSVTGK